jgi:hypothetical protein
MTMASNARGILQVLQVFVAIASGKTPDNVSISNDRTKTGQNYLLLEADQQRLLNVKMDEGFLSLLASILGWSHVPWTSA